VTSENEGVVCPLVHGTLLHRAGRAAILLDRDGVLIEDTGYPDDPEQIIVLPRVPEALRALQSEGFRLVVVTNQSGVARGKFTLERLDEIHDRLRSLLLAQGVELDALYYCPHHAGGSVAAFTADCDHRKPQPGMLRTAALELGLDLDASWMIGDKESDVRAGHAAGCRSGRIGAGETAAEVQAADLPEAVAAIVNRTRDTR